MKIVANSYIERLKVKMKIGEAAQLLNVSHTTVHNWIKTGKLKLNKILSNGYRDINDESVYECIACTYEPSEKKNRIVIFAEDGSVMKFEPDSGTVARIVEYLGRTAACK